ncbi:hypothetical protein [Pseudovibrio ascidiaceicola]|uniref:hypothetical protein n=1 Tax=Pseudovibrio ascidiaceicola TaxID=285279 RepID=UPI000D693D17|nr:hypothetical protein [Pseudovibrio ascidiaceicola]
MTLLQFLSSLISSLAWPTVAVVALVFLREPIVQTVPRLQRFKYKELEADFSRELEKIEQEAKESGLKEVENTEAIIDFEEHLQQIAEISPNAAIVEAFGQIEKSAKAVIKKQNERLDYKVAAPYRLIERFLESTDILGKKEIKIFRDLRLLRNKVTHSESYFATREQAQDYIELAAILIGKFDESLETSSAV